MRQDVRNRIQLLLERSAAVAGSEDARELEEVMTAYKNVRFCAG
jgi:hypothetical protein